MVHTRACRILALALTRGSASNYVCGRPSCDWHTWMAHHAQRTLSQFSSLPDDVPALAFAPRQRCIPRLGHFTVCSVGNYNFLALPLLNPRVQAIPRSKIRARKRRWASSPLLPADSADMCCKTTDRNVMATRTCTYASLASAKEDGCCRDTQPVRLCSLSKEFVIAADAQQRTRLLFSAMPVARAFGHI